jgi:starch-binding outer membrane protein, SusD/RagB family
MEIMKMLINKFIHVVLIATAMFFVSCESLMDPVPENIYDDSRFIKDPGFAEGLILNAYTRLPSSYNFNETATDDAVSNNQAHPFTRLATGEWSSRYDPLSAWDQSYEQIYYLNRFLNMASEIEFSWQSPDRDQMFRNRFTGEAKALRAWYNFQLLRSHGGIDEKNNALGFIIMRHEDVASVDRQQLMSRPRNSYEECVQFILADLQDAAGLLPDKYLNTSDADYNKVFGSQNQNRINGLAVKALKARVLLHVASQPFVVGYRMEDAANAAAALITQFGGVNAIVPTGYEWYLNKDNAEIIWRRDVANINSWERENFPPSLFGEGRVNPTQNLVDAFPMRNGYPIGHSQSGYVTNSPYTNRDQRLRAYVLFNGNTMGTRVVNTNKESTLDGINNTVNSTRTGYYLKKLLNGQVNLTPNINSSQPHFYTFFRYTEMFLIYAEAANEAWGPTTDPGSGFTATDAISALRIRAGIAQPDNFLTESSASKEEMRALIRNERRIELCFEGFRFWDLRRWDAQLNQATEGVLISGGIYSIINVENRIYQPHMKYGPIPYREILKSKDLVQNKGW